MDSVAVGDGGGSIESCRNGNGISKKSAAARRTTLKVRFFKAAKDMPDEVVDERDVFERTDEMLRLKKVSLRDIKYVDKDFRELFHDNYE